MDEHVSAAHGRTPSEAAPVSMEDARFAKESNEIMYPPELLWLTMRAASDASAMRSFDGIRERAPLLNS
jgi:hypothetical protein